MKTLKTTLIICIALIAFNAFGQTPVVHISFDNCDGTDVQGGLNNFVQSSTVDCDCGIEFNAAYFDSETDTIHLDDEIKSLFNEDFTISIHFWVDDQIQPYSIFSIQDDCSKDSIFLIKYIPQIGELDVQISKNFGLGAFMIAAINPDRCWHHLVFTKSGKEYALTVDDVFIEKKVLTEEIVMGEKHKIRLGTSPCLNTQETFMRGRIDEIKIFDFPLSTEEQGNLVVEPDQIITIDTTIFAGSNIPIETGGTCSPNFSWSPTAGLSDPFDIEPIATPDVSTTYFLNIDHGTCLTRDSIEIFVIEEENIDCAELLLPNVFTPNGDNVNDILEISNKFIIQDLSYFDIYDRWGSKVFSAVNKDDGWDGSFDGITQSPSMYVYKIEYTCRDEVFQKVGNFSLLK